MFKQGLKKKKSA